MATLGRWSGGSATHPTESWASPNGLGTTQDRNDSSAYSWASSTARLTLPSTGLADGYLVVARLHYTTTHNNRHTHNARFTTNSGTGNFLSSTTGGYSRNTANNENFVLTWAIVDNPSASYSLDYEWKRDTGDGTTAGSVTDFVIDVIPLYYSDIALYSSTSTSLLGGTTPSTLPLTSTVVEGTNITRSGNVITVTGDNKRYLIFGSNYTEGRGGRTQRWVGGEYDGTQDRGAMACIYHRDTGTDESGIAFSDIIETVTASRTIEQFVYRGDGVANNEGGANIDGSTPAVGAHAMAVIELNDSAEVFRSTNASATAQDISQGESTNVDISAVNTVTFNDSASFTKVSATAVNAEQAMDALLGANLGGAYNTVSSGTRYTGRARFTVNGTEDADTFHGNYGRGNQSSADTFGFSANPVAFVGLSSGDDVGVSANEIGDAGPVDIQPAWAGFWGINLDTLEVTADNNIAEQSAAATLTLTAQINTATTTENNFSSQSAAETLTLTAQTNTATATDNNQSAQATAEALTLTANTHTANATANNTSEQASAGSLSLTAQTNTAETTEKQISDQVSPETLTLTGQSSTAEATENNIAEGVAGSLTLTGQTSLAVTAQGQNSVQSAPGSLTLTAQTNTANTTEANVAEGVAGTLSLTGQTSSALTTEAKISEQSAAEALTLTGQTSSAITTEGADNTAQGTVGALTLTGQTSAAETTEKHISAQSLAEALTLSGLSGSAITTEGANNTATGVTGTLTLTAQTNTAETTEKHIATGVLGVLSLAGQVHTAQSADNNTAQGVAGSLTLAGQTGSAVVSGPQIAAQSAPETLILAGFAGSAVTTVTETPSGTLFRPMMQSMF